MLLYLLATKVFIRKNPTFFMISKIKVSGTIDKILFDEIRKRGLNLSKTLNSALYQYFFRVQNETVTSSLVMWRPRVQFPDVALFLKK